MKKLILLFGVVLFCSCQKKDELPNEIMIQNSLQEIIAKVSEKKVELIKFKKTNGQTAKVHEIDMYNVEFIGKIKFKENGWSEVYQPLDYNKGWLHIRNTKPYYSSSYWEEVKKDTEREIKGYITFSLKENGWSRTNTKVILVHK